MCEIKPASVPDGPGLGDVTAPARAAAGRWMAATLRGPAPRPAPPGAAVAVPPTRTERPGCGKGVPSPGAGEPSGSGCCCRGDTQAGALQSCREGVCLWWGCLSPLLPQSLLLGTSLQRLGTRVQLGLVFLGMQLQRELEEGSLRTGGGSSGLGTCRRWPERRMQPGGSQGVLGRWPTGC